MIIVPIGHTECRKLRREIAVDIELTELKKEFLEEAEAKIVEIRSRLREAGETPADESIQRMINLAHQLKGAGGSYGYSAVSTHAAKLEDALEVIDAGGNQSFDPLEKLADALAEEISRQRDALSRETPA